MNRSPLLLYRDLLRLIEHVAARTPKGDALRAQVRAEFDRNKHETNPVKIAEHKAAGQRALSNYLVVESLSKLKYKKPKPPPGLRPDLEPTPPKSASQVIEELTKIQYKDGQGPRASWKE